ncbi:MAG: site-2 protease family protein [Solirubrobacteraceae bacterium]
MGGRSIQLARILGIRIGASPSWFFVLLLMIVWLSQGYDDRYGQTTGYLVAVASALAFFVSLVLHELGHALAARRSGIGIDGIDLWLFGGIAKLTRDSRSPGEELRIAGAGPVVTFVIVLLCAAVGMALGGRSGFSDAVALTGDPAPGLALIGWLGLVNAFLLVFNLVPAFPLDGGRIARAVAWRVTGDRNRGTRFSARLGQMFSWTLILGGLYVAARISTFDGIWLAALGWFLGQAASGAVASSRFSERLQGVTAGDVMDTEPVWVPGDTTVGEAHDDFFLRWRAPWFPVADPVSGRFLGLLREPAVDEAIRTGHPASPVTDVVDLGDEGFRVRDDTPIEQLLASEGLRSLGALMVVDAHDSLRGVVTLDQVRRALTATATGGRLA